MSWKLWVALGLVAWGSFTSYQLRGSRLELSEYKLKVSQANEQAQAKKIADYKQAQRSNLRIQDAQRKMEEWLAADRARVERSIVSLRGVVAHLNSRPAPTDPSAQRYAHEAATARSALEQCSGRYRWVDGEAKKLGSQVIGLQSFIVEVCRAGSVDDPAPTSADPLVDAAPH